MKIKKISNEIILKYKINEKDKKEGKIKIFGYDFVLNNKYKIKIKINEKEEELKQYLEIKDKDQNGIEIKLIGIEKVTNMSWIFKGCSSLLNLPDISKWNTINVTDRSCMFSDCYFLLNLPDFSKWNTNNVISMSSMFYCCKEGLNIPAKFMK